MRTVVSATPKPTQIQAMCAMAGQIQTNEVTVIKRITGELVDVAMIVPASDDEGKYTWVWVKCSQGTTRGFQSGRGLRTREEIAQVMLGGSWEVAPAATMVLDGFDFPKSSAVAQSDYATVTVSMDGYAVHCTDKGRGGGRGTVNTSLEKAMKIFTEHTTTEYLK